MNVPALLRTRSRCLYQLKLKNKVLNTACCSSTAVEEKIEIPKRIPRGPTDILRALESTITRDPTAAHYKYHDDPFLIPMSNAGKRSFALAQEAGRKAAHWIRNEHSELFQHKESEPPIEAYFPKMVYKENSDVTENDLQKVIKSVLISDAIFVYKLLEKKNVEISLETKQDLLELLCFYNGDDTLSEEFIEERWFQQSSKVKERKGKTWKDEGIAEELFISIDKPNSSTYSALIQGMAKHFQVDRALQLFKESQEKDIVLNTNAYNALISVANYVKESHDLRWAFVVDMLTSMNTAKLRPNLGTLNAILEASSTMGGAKNVKQNVLSTLAEFKQIGVEPSLASWYYVLITFCKESGPVSTILYDIMGEIENKEHKIRDIKDTNFFVTAMDVCRNHLRDKELGKRVDNLLHFGNNYDLLGDSYKESIYYRHYFSLLCATEPIEDFMKNVYNTLVPHIYIPEPMIMGEIIKAVEAADAIEFIPKIWSDMIVFDHTGRENLIISLMRLMVDNKPLEDSDLNERFSYIAWDIFYRIENQNENKVQKLSFTGQMLGNIMLLLLRNGDFDKAATIMKKLDKDIHSIVGVPMFEAMSLFVDACIKEKLPSLAIDCIQYCSDCGFPEAVRLAEKLKSALTLDENHLAKLRSIFGDFSAAQVEQLEYK